MISRKEKSILRRQVKGVGVFRKTYRTFSYGYKA